MIPNNLKSNPYTILIFYDIYNYLVLPLYRQLRFILSELIDVITNIDMVTLIRNTFSDQLENIFQLIQERLLIRI